MFLKKLNEWHEVFIGKSNEEFSQWSGVWCPACSVGLYNILYSSQIDPVKQMFFSFDEMCQPHLVTQEQNILGIFNCHLSVITLKRHCVTWDRYDLWPLTCISEHELHVWFLISISPLRASMESVSQPINPVFLRQFYPSFSRLVGSAEMTLDLNICLDDLRTRTFSQNPKMT